MSSREKILAAVRANKPDLQPLPDVIIPVREEGLIEEYRRVAEGIGAKVYEVGGIAEVKELLAASFEPSQRIVSPLEDFADMAEGIEAGIDPHSFADVELAIVRAEIGVSENSALWVPEGNVSQRVIPFICQHLAILINRERIVPTLQQAYSLIGEINYGYGVFIAGPSKTADIEQSLVLGAHGPRSLRVFIVG
ncbi:LutC/YkgG family protein [Desertivirga xinjiangensis]|uniref:LutC/YkgG family protein n=1 Tax=Desertivirga xinjiangensis TaxID=539206 RepID=UPI00210868CD|nr:LUD domain-containing protein [Pedobacter xinjiangensis]